MRYGLPYKGSKNQIAEDILKFLPRGKRLVDLFGGGGSISHCASLSYKWNAVLYNEINPLVCKAFKMAINGEFKDETRWISREDFFRLRETDPYVAICFSFGNNMTTYLYHVDIEEWRKACFYANMFNDYSLFESQYGLNKKDALYEYVINQGMFNAETDFYDIFRDDASMRLNRIKQMQIKLPIEVTNGSYTAYVYRDGDIVYCDPPYESTDCRGYKGFDSEAFYQWVETRPYTVYFSTYEMKKLNDRFYKVWEQEKRILSSQQKNIKYIEAIYSNKASKALKEDKQLLLFEEI